MNFDNIALIFDKLKKKSFCLKLKIPLQSIDYKGNFSVVLLRFELRQADPETAVLPLHHKTVVFLLSGKNTTNIFYGQMDSK